MGSTRAVRNYLPAVGVLAAVTAGYAAGMAPWLLWGDSARPDVVFDRALIVIIAGFLLPILPAIVIGGMGGTYRTGAVVILVVTTAASIALGFHFGARPYETGAEFDMNWVPAAFALLLVPVGLGSLLGYALGRGTRPKGMD